LARLLHGARISLYVQFRKYGLKRQVQMDWIYTVGAIVRTYVDTVWTLYEYVTVNFCYFQIAV
jgi:hypothetical protein